jgi:hypothetical protein
MLTAFLHHCLASAAQACLMFNHSLVHRSRGALALAALLAALLAAVMQPGVARAETAETVQA